MKALVVAFLLGGTILSAHAQTAAKDRGPRVEGTILRFECGDNCWLTINWGDDQELTALCLAKACAPWNMRAAMPKDLVGKDVSAVLGAGAAVNGEGEIQNYALAFTDLKID